MRVNHRPYDELNRDFERIWRFLLDDYAYRQDQFIWLSSRFGDWKYGLWGENKYFPPFYRENAELWFNDVGELLGFAICESGDENFTIFTRQNYGFLYGEILEWVMAHWSDRGKLRTEIHEFQPEDMRSLECHGFTNRKQIGINRQYRLADKAAEPVVLPDGFQIVDCLTDTNYHSKRALQRNAFEDTDIVRNVDMWAYAYARECPAYFPQYDLSVINSEGKHVASCVGYADFEHRIAEIEKVCTHSDYRRKGLGEAVIRACFHRLAADGFEYAYIMAYGADAAGLYGKLGGVREKKWYLFEIS